MIQVFEVCVFYSFALFLDTAKTANMDRNLLFDVSLFNMVLLAALHSAFFKD